MNVLYLIGNGFDKSLGLKTAYSDFYDYYCSLDDKDERVCALKNEIEADKQNWADLELALGKYSGKIERQQDFEDVFFNLSDNLVQHLRNQQGSIADEELDKPGFCNMLFAPASELTGPDRRRVPMGNAYETNTVDIITFNYTNILDRLLESKGGMVNVASKNANNGITWRVRSLRHVHGTLDGTIVMGVNDVSQVANKAFAENQDVRDLLVKPESNSSIKADVDTVCKNLIETADTIIIFGSSLGETDKLWWQLIGQRLSRQNTRLIIYFYDAGLNIGANREQLRGRMERKVRQQFLDVAGLELDEDKMRDKILVGVNTRMFAGIRKKGVGKK